MSKRNIKLMPFADLSAYMGGFKIVSTQWGPDGKVYVLLINQVPERERGMFVQTHLNQTYTYKVLTLSDKHIEEVIIWGQTYIYHYVQPLHDHLCLSVHAVPTTGMISMT